MWAVISMLFGLVGCNGQVAYQPANALPIQFTLDNDGHFSVQAVKSWVTPIGRFEITTDLATAPS